MNKETFYVSMVGLVSLAIIIGFLVWAIRTVDTQGAERCKQQYGTEARYTGNSDACILKNKHLVELAQ